MAKAYPQEFRDDVVAVARKGQAPLSQIGKDFGISEGTLSNWVKRADVEDGHRPGLTEKQSLEVRELKKRNRLLESMYVGLDRRLYRCLLDLAEIYGPDEARPVIPFTQEQLADLVGGTRPSVNQVLQRLLAQGVIEVGRGRVVITDRVAPGDQGGSLSRRPGQEVVASCVGSPTDRGAVRQQDEVTAEPQGRPQPGSRHEDHRHQHLDHLDHRRVPRPAPPPLSRIHRPPHDDVNSLGGLTAQEGR